MNKLSKRLLIVALVAVAIASCAFLAACGDDAPATPAEFKPVGATMVVAGYEWGPGVPKIVLEFSGDVSGADKDTFKVKTGATTRAVTSVYASDDQGNAASGASKFLTIEMETNSREASPFTYDMTSSVNNWTESISYKFTINSDKSLTIGGSKVESGSYTYKFTADDRIVPDTAVFTKDTHQTGSITLTRAAFTPEGATTDSGKNPLIIWLHGMGEGGTDIDIALLGNEVTALTRPELQQYFTTNTQKGAYVLAVQTPTMWMDSTGSGEMNTSSPGSPQLSYYTDALYAAITDYVDNNADIDTSRIYLGGCSNGGYMTMNMMFTHGDYFAAYYPICEAYMNVNIDDAMITQIKDYNIWFLHSEDDTTVYPTATTIPTYYRLLNEGATNVNFSMTAHVRGIDDTEPSGYGAPAGFYMGHWSWIMAFNDDVKTRFDNAAALADYGNVTIEEGVVTSTGNYVTAANCTTTENMWEWLAKQAKPQIS